jgi:ribosome-associated protein
MNDDIASQLDLYVQAALGKKAEGMVVLDLRDLTSIADAFVICSGRSNRQVIAIADHIERFLKKKGVRPLGVEGKDDGHWVLMDYGNVVIHIFYWETRSFYDLEGFWIDAKKIRTQSMQAEAKPQTDGFDGKEIIVD